MLYLNIPDEVEILIDDNWIQIKGPLGFIKKKKIEFNSNILWS